MAYSKTVWANNTTPAINQTNLNKIEDALSALHSATGIDYTPSGTGAVDRTIEARLQDWKSLLDFGADPTGAADSTAAIKAWLESGGNLYAPAGTYLIAEAGADAGGVEATISESITVLCAGGCTFKAEADLDNDMIRIYADETEYTATRQLTVDWKGGLFDQTEQKNSTVTPFDTTFVPPNVGTSATCDGLSIQGRVDVGGTYVAGFSLVTVRDVTFYASTTNHWESAGGDGGLFIDAAMHKHVSNCVGIGCRDLAIYCSGIGDELDTNPAGSTVIRDNRFYGCFFGCSTKRTSNNAVIANNIGYNTGAVVIEIDANNNSGNNVLIYGNVGYQAWYVVRASGTSGAVIDGNVSYKHGHLDESGAAFASVFTNDNACVRLEGVSGAIVRNNSVNLQNDVSSYTVSCVRVGDYDSTLSSGNYVYNNIAKGVNYCIYETAGEAEENYYWGNRRFSMDSPADLIESSSYNFDAPLHEDNTQAAHTGAVTYTTMSTATIPAGLLLRDNRLHLQASGSCTGTAGTKEVGIVVGSKTVQAHTPFAASYTGPFVLDGYIDFTTTTTGIRLSFTVVGDGVSGAVQYSFNEDFDAGDIDISLQFKLGDAADTMTFETFVVRVE